MSSKSDTFGGSLIGAGALPTSLSSSSTLLMTPSQPKRSDSISSNNNYHKSNTSGRRKASQIKRNLISKDAMNSTLRSSQTSNSNNLFSNSTTLDENKMINIVRAKSVIKYGFGSNMTGFDSIQTLGLSQGNDKDNNDRLIFKIGNQIVAYDPDTTAQHYFDVNKNVLCMNHFITSQNHRYMAVCETTASETELAIQNSHPIIHSNPLSSPSTSNMGTATSGTSTTSVTNNNESILSSLLIREEDKTISNITLYDIKTMKRLKTISRPKYHEFLMSSFSADSRTLIALIEITHKSTITDGDTNMISSQTLNSKEVMLYSWEKDKIIKTFPISDGVRRVRGGSGLNMIITASGLKHLKSYYINADSGIKSTNLLPPSSDNSNNNKDDDNGNNREQEYDFLDHIWLSPQNGIHKMVVLAESVSSSSNNTQNSSLHDHSSHNTNGGGGGFGMNKKQCIFVFEGVESAPTSNVAGTLLNVPINLELRQTIVIKSTQTIGFRIESIAPCGKGFIAAGSYGHVAIYDRTDEKRDPYVEVKKFALGHLHFVGVAVYPSEDKFNVLADSGRILSVTMDASLHMRNTLAKQSLLKDPLTGQSNNSTRSLPMREEDFDITTGNIQGVLDVIPGGFHQEPIKSSDIAFNRPVMITLSSDRTARIWNYETMKCELVHNFGADEPLAVAIHSSGFQALVSFKDRVRLYNIVMDKLKPYQETIQKSCKDIKFSNGCQYWAGASGISVVVYDTKSFTQLTTFQGHMMSVQRLLWAPGDQILFTMGMDGNVYGWLISSISSNPSSGASNSDSRIDIVTANNRASTLTSMAIDCPPTSFHKPGPIGTNIILQDNITGQIIIDNDHRSQLILPSVDGNMKMPSYNLDKSILSIQSNGLSLHSSGNNHYGDSSYAMQYIYGYNKVSVTSLCLTTDRKYLIAGTSIGSIRVYAWPPPIGIEGADGGLYVETLAHSGPVTSIVITPHGTNFLSTGEDGVVFLHNLLRGVEYERSLIQSSVGSVPTNIKSPIVLGSNTTIATSSGGGGGGIITLPEKNMNNSRSHGHDHEEDEQSEEQESFRYNTEVVMVTSEEIDEHVHEVIELHKILSDVRAKNSYDISELIASHADEMKKQYDRHESILYEEQLKYDTLKSEYDRRVLELTTLMETKDIDYIKRSTELENRYEHKLADQLDRYDRLAEEMEALRQNCEALLREERLRTDKVLSDIRHDSITKEKRLTVENKRLFDDKKNEANTFQEILEQQEDEYEDELRQLIGAAEAELGSEREIVLNLRTIVQTKNTKLDQMKKKLEELNNIAKARLKLLDNERNEKVRLMETLNHYKKNLKEREDVLSEKEKIISDLRNTTRTLENFRFVLDHRLQQLSAERGPITNHIERLERHIRTMYEELVEEFDLKKSSADEISTLEAKLTRSAKDLTAAKYEVTLKERHEINAQSNHRYITSFKRDLENMVASILTGKELEEAIQQLYKKYIRNSIDGTDGKNSSMNAIISHIESNGLGLSSENLTKGNPKVREKVDSLLHSNPIPSSYPNSISHSLPNVISNNVGHNVNHVLSNSMTSFNSLTSLNNNNNNSNGNNSNINSNSNNNNSNSNDKKFIREVEEALVDTAKESDRQRLFKEREVHDLRHRLSTEKTQSDRTSHRLIRDNINILTEYNNIKKYSKILEHQLNITREQLKKTQLQLANSSNLNSNHPIPISTLESHLSPRNAAVVIHSEGDKMINSSNKKLIDTGNHHPLEENLNLSDSIISNHQHVGQDDLSLFSPISDELKSPMIVYPEDMINTTITKSSFDQNLNTGYGIGTNMGISIGYDSRFSPKISSASKSKGVGNMLTHVDNSANANDNNNTNNSNNSNNNSNAVKVITNNTFMGITKQTATLLEKSRKLSNNAVVSSTSTTTGIIQPNSTNQIEDLVISNTTPKLQVISSTLASSKSDTKLGNKGKVGVIKSVKMMPASSSSSLNKQIEIVTSKLEKEIETLHQLLDDSTREKEMQRYELGRLRRQVTELVNRIQDIQSHGQQPFYSNQLQNPFPIQSMFPEQVDQSSFKTNSLIG